MISVAAVPVHVVLVKQLGNFLSQYSSRTRFLASRWAYGLYIYESLFSFLSYHLMTVLHLQQSEPLSSAHLIFHYVFIVFCPSNWTEMAAKGF